MLLHFDCLYGLSLLEVDVSDWSGQWTYVAMDGSRRLDEHHKRDVVLHLQKLAQLLVLNWTARRRANARTAWIKCRLGAEELRQRSFLASIVTCRRLCSEYEGRPVVLIASQCADITLHHYMRGTRTKLDLVLQ